MQELTTNIKQRKELLLPKKNPCAPQITTKLYFFSSSSSFEPKDLKQCKELLLPKKNPCAPQITTKLYFFSSSSSFEPKDLKQCKELLLPKKTLVYPRSQLNCTSSPTPPSNQRI
jgi:hypothetical protein